MRLPSWRHWSVRARLMAMTAIPLAYLFCTFVWYAYQSRLAEVREELAERGPLVAKVLADSSEFSLASRRYDDLKPTINGLLRTDPSLARIEVLDGQRRVLVQAAARSTGPVSELRYYEAPILKRLMWVAMLGPDGRPYQKDRPMTASSVTVETMGYVRVSMSPSALLLKQTGRFYVELLVGCIGLLACVLLAWQLAKGLDASLQASMRALREADAEKRRLISKVHTAVEDERKSIALEIHDELNATLIAVRLEAQRIADMSAGETRDKARSIGTLALGLYNSGRTLVRRLRPEVLDMLGLDGAVEEVVRHYDSTYSGCRFEFQAHGDFSDLEGNVAISAYRIVQEALSNIVKHARATHASVSLVLAHGELRMQVVDNGAGFDVMQASDGIGLVGMRERVYACNGNIGIETGLTAGTRITIAMPIR